METAEAASSILKLPLFHGYGVELEYMIVDRDTLDVLPITDKLFHVVTGSYVSDVSRGDITWSNELALHVLELKVSRPSPQLDGLQHAFQAHVHHLNQILKHFNAMLMPTGMHPWMNPYKELKLWPHDSNPIYEAFHGIFDCRGHGWANLQSSHLNFSFASEEEFVKLHAAIRFVLPILPALAASSPIVEGKLTHLLDNRLHYYMSNSRMIPSITGKVIPESVSSIKDYEERILQKMYQDIAPKDPQKILQHEWLNARGAIARFERYTIEIRLLDTQECPAADLAIAQTINALLQGLVNEKWASISEIRSFELEELYSIFLSCQKDGEMALINNSRYLKLLGFDGDRALHAGKIWQKIAEEMLLPALSAGSSIQKALKTILTQGTLASRIQKAWEKDPTQENLKKIYRRLCVCLDTGRQFLDEPATI